MNMLPSLDIMRLLPEIILSTFAILIMVAEPFTATPLKKLLGWMFEQGAEFRTAYLMTRYIVEEITQNGSRTNGSDTQARNLNGSGGQAARP